MKTSPKSTVALLAILALGGSTAGSLFTESLQTNQTGSIGTAGEFFPDREISIPVQQTEAIADKSDASTDEIVTALPIEEKTVTPDPVTETQVRAITTEEVTQTMAPVPSPVPTTSETPVVITEPTPQASPEVSASQTPEPEVELSESDSE
jgi:hypothetical protein